MRLARPRIDIRLSTNDVEPLLAFWQGQMGVALDHALPIRRGVEQHRHDGLGSVLKTIIMRPRCRLFRRAATANC